MAMKLVKKTDEYSIYKRGDDRYAVKGADKQPINGLDKARILVEEGLIKVTLPNPSAAAEEAEEVAAEAPEGEASAAAEAPAEEAAAAEEEAPAEAEAPAEDEDK